MRTKFGGIGLLALLIVRPVAANESNQNRLVDIATVPPEQRMESACSQIKQLEDTAQREDVSKDVMLQLRLVEALVCTPYHLPSR